MISRQTTKITETTTIILKQRTERERILILINVKKEDINKKKSSTKWLE